MLHATFANGMFVGQHGSWDRKPHSGYKVIFVPFENGKPSSTPVDVLTGFLSEDGEAFGRPVVWCSTSRARCWWPTMWECGLAGDYAALSRGSEILYISIYYS